MELIEAIYSRRTARKFTPQSVSDDALFEILEAGTWAPSHGNNQPWEFLLIGDETRQRMQEAYLKAMEAGPLMNPELPDGLKQMIRNFSQNFGDAPVLLAVVNLPAVTPLEKYDFPMSAAAAIQNIFLAAWKKGIAGVWLSFGSNPAAHSVLGVSEDRHIAGILAMGYPETIPPAQPRISVKEKLRRLP